MVICARYGSAAEFNLFERTYRVSFPPIFALPQEIIYPHTPGPVIVENDNTMDLKLMNYSLVPAWSKVRKPKFATYNARIEEITSKPSWKKPFESKHCLVPIKGFIESVYTGPYAGHNITIEAKDHRLLTAAGIWDSWIDKASGEMIESYAIITAEPPKDILEAGHDRCPIFLTEEGWKKWLRAEGSASDMLEVLRECREEVEFGFGVGERLKQFQHNQLSLFDD